MGHVTLTTPLLRVIYHCHSYTGTWHTLHACRIWPLLLQPFRRYRWCPPKLKWFTWLDHAPFTDGFHAWVSTCYNRPVYGLPNLKSLSLPNAKTWKAIQNIENVMVLGSKGSLKVNGNSAIR